MTHTWFILIGFLVSITSTQAQINFRGGVTAGLATTQISGDDLGGFHKVGPFLGGFLRAEINETLSGQMEIAYTQKGSRKIPKADQGNTFYTLKLNYIEVPLLLKANFRKFTYEVGPSIGTLLNYQEFTHVGDFFPARDFRRVELSFNAGIGYVLTEKATLTWRFNNSILPVRKHVGNNTFRFNLGQYSTALNFLVHYRF